MPQVPEPAAFAPELRVVASVEHDTLDPLASVRLAPGRDEGTVVDLLIASSGIEDNVVALAEPLEVLPGVVVPVARVGHLLALKLLAVRGPCVARALRPYPWRGCRSGVGEFWRYSPP